jgi:hypothetical protein
MNKIQALEEKFKEVYYIEGSVTYIRALIAISASAYTSGDPIWLMLIGGSGSGKSEAINILGDINYCHQISMLTPNTLLSGAKKGKDGKDPSLLTRLGKHGVILMKDFTTIISMREDNRRDILAQIREVYDGELTKETGTGLSLSWRGKLNFIAGSTSSYYEKQKEIDSMGPRFIMYEIDELSNSGRKDFLRFARNNMNDIKSKRSELQSMARDAVEEILEKMPDDLPMLPEKIDNNLVDLADFVAKARTPVSRDFHGNITVVHFKELPGRLYSQVYRLGQMFLAIAQMNGRDEMDKDEEELLYKFLLNSIPKQKRDVLYTLFKYKEATTKSIAHILNIQTESVKLWLSDLNALALTLRVSAGGKDFWYVSPENSALLSRMLDIPVTDISLDVSDGDMQISSGHQQKFEYSEKDYPEINQSKNNEDQKGWEEVGLN